jgi:hypothetical protein
MRPAPKSAAIARSSRLYRRYSRDARRAETCIDGLAHSDRHRDVTEVLCRRVRLRHGVASPPLSVLSVIFTKSTPSAAERRLVEIGLSHLDAFPDRLDPSIFGPELNSVGPNNEPSAIARRRSAPPGMSPDVANRGDAMRHIERQQRLVLLDQFRSAAEMDMHVPEPGHQVLFSASTVCCRSSSRDLRPFPAATMRFPEVAKPGPHQARTFDIDHGGVAQRAHPLTSRAVAAAPVMQCRRKIGHHLAARV